MKAETGRAGRIRTKGRFFFALLFSILFLASASVQANPFLGTENRPSVRPPGSGSPALLSGASSALREKIASLMEAAGDNPAPSTVILFYTTLFLYGAVHAAGPGHRKGLLFTIFVSRRSGPAEPALAGFYSSFLHAGSAVAIILALEFLTRQTPLAAGSEAVSVHAEGLSLTALALLALYLAFRNLCALISKKRASAQGAAAAPAEGKNLFLLITAASLFPCPGAILILLFSLSLDSLCTGITGVMAMSAGMGVVISAVAYLARSGRNAFLSVVETGKAEKAAEILEFISYLILAGFSLWMGWPYIVSYLS